MRAGVRPDPVVRKGQTRYRVVDLDTEEKAPLLNSSGDPIDGGGHKVEGISKMLAREANEAIARRTGKPVVDEDEE
jgi:hypothetical protein